MVSSSLFVSRTQENLADVDVNLKAIVVYYNTSVKTAKKMNLGPKNQVRPICNRNDVVIVA